MLKIQNLWLALAAALTCGALSGATALIALDFTGVDGLARAWSAVTATRTVETAPAAPDPLVARLQGVGEIALFTSADVPGSTLKIQTGTAYANAHDLAAGTVASRWCYAQRGGETSAFQPTVALGNQKAAQAPVLFQAAGLSADEARQLGSTPETLADLARRLCRFGA